jgi:hypothetical protein
MADENEHALHVDAWLARTTPGLSQEQHCVLFQLALGALWQRAHRTLGDVTLSAIVDRVLFSATEQYPFLAAVRVDAKGTHSDELVESSRSVDPHTLAAGLRLVLVDFLTVLGNLTAEILSAALHAELSKVALADSSPSDEERHSGPRNGERNGEDSEP